MKPILFNTDMVRAILDGRKTVTRRLVKPQDRIPEDAYFGYTAFTPKYHISARGYWKDKCGEKRFGETFFKLPYRHGDVLYVRETWAAWSRTMGIPPTLYYKADKDAPDGIKWRPSIHMPREAARIFLRVTDVRVERLQDISEEQAEAEGCAAYMAELDENGYWEPATLDFIETWNSTIKPADRALYGWDANPWVWAIEFERCEKPEEGST